MSDHVRDSIRSAIQIGFSRCSRATERLACLAEFVGSLRQNGWREAHVHEVESAVRRMLAGVLVERGNGIWPPEDRLAGFDPDQRQLPFDH